MKLRKVYSDRSLWRTTNVMVSISLLALTGCMETKIRDTFMDRTAPDAASQLAWTQWSGFTVSGTSDQKFTQLTNLDVKWKPSTSADTTAQEVQLYVGSNCNQPSNNPVRYSGNSQASHQFKSLPEGTYSFKIISYDRKNNTSYSKCSSAVTKDTQGPVVTITTPAASAWINKQNILVVSGICTDSGVGITNYKPVAIKISNDQNASQEVTGAASCSDGTFTVTMNGLSNLTDGGNHLHLTATVLDDLNQSTTSPSVTLSRDIVDPAIALTITDGSWINNANQSSFTVAGTCSDATSGLTNKHITVTATNGIQTVNSVFDELDSEKNVFCKSNGQFNIKINLLSFPDTSTANISVTAQVTDGAGNSKTSTEINLKKDTVVPVLAITSPASGGYVKAAASIPISFTLVEENATGTQSLNFTYNNGTSSSSNSVSFSNGPFSNSNKGTFTQNINTLGLTHASTVSVSVAYTDPAGNAATTAAANYTIDTGAPTITSFTLNGGNPATMNNNVIVSLNASNALSPVTHYCLKNKVASTTTVPTAPSEQDACWIAISLQNTNASPDRNVNLSNFYYQVGFLQNSYDVYAWVKNGAGLISSLTSGVGQASTDKFTVNYNPGSPPVISAVQVTNTNSPTSPIPSEQMTFNANNTQMYIKWNATDNEGLLTTANPINIYYTTNNTDYSPLTANGVPNASEAGCSIAGEFTGCTVLTVPTAVYGSYFKIRVEAKDTNQTTVFYNSVPLNSSNFKVIAGNTETGFGGSAKTAVFNMLGSGAQLSYVSSHRLAVSTDGKYFYLDPAYGLVWVNPANGNLVSFIETNFNSPTVDADNGSDVATAKLKEPLGIAMDYSNRLLIYDHDRIRRVDLSTMKISTIIGGGSTSITNNTSINPRSVKLYSPSLWGISLTMTPLPNGDLLFTSQDSGYSNNYDWKYKPNGTIEPIHYVDSDNKGLGNDPELSWDFLRTVSVGSPPISRTLLTRRIGFGVAYDPNQAVSFTANVFLKGFLYEIVSDTFPRYARIDYNSGSASANYNSIPPVNLGMLDRKSITTGLDGRIYAIERGRSLLERYDYDTNALSSVLGTGFTPNIPCADNTPVLQCAVDIDSYFVSRTGTVYFMDQGTLRTINDGKVITLFGQFASHGTGSALTALNARFGRITDLKLDRSSSGFNRTVVWDTFAKRFREVIKNGDVSDLTSTAFSWAGPYKFEMDPATGDIFYTNDSRIYRYSKQGVLTPVVGGSTDWANVFYQPDTDGKGGNQVILSHYPRSLIGFIDGEIYQETNLWNNVDLACMVKKYNSSQSYTQSHFLGDMTCNGTWVVGSATDRTGASIGLDVSRVEKFGNTLLFGRRGTQNIYTKNAQDQLQLFATVGRGINSFTHSASLVNGEPNIYYCQGGNAIYQFNRTSGSATSSNEVTYTLPQGINCLNDSTIHYVENGGTKSIIFAFGQNGLYGVGEYILP